MALANTFKGLRREAEALAAPYPTLLAEAERVAAIVAQGDHGRRRAGQGETFWQYRNYDTSDSSTQIDWRRSARGDQVYVRETEWEAANTVYFWRDGSPGMAWSSSDTHATKRDRATVLLMAISSLLMRAGERCAVIGESERPRAGRVGLDRITRRLASSPGQAGTLDAKLPRHARMVVTSDFLEGADVWADRLARFSAVPVTGLLVQVIDPAEHAFPYRGRVKMQLPGLEPFLVGRAEKAAERYRIRFDAHCKAIEDLARRTGWPLVVHHTDQPATPALTRMHAILSGNLR